MQVDCYNQNISYDFIEPLNQGEENRNMARTQSRLDTRKDFESSLGPLRDIEWEFLVAKGYPDEIRRLPSTRDRVFDEAKGKIRLIRGRNDLHNEPNDQEVLMLSEQETKQSTKRIEIISTLVAQEAADDDGVRLFRTEILDDKLLSLKEIEEWIQQQVQKDGTPSTWLNNVPISTAQANELLRLQQTTTQDKFYLSLEIPRYEVTESLHILQYPGLDGWARSIPTADGGVLERLRRLSDRLAEKYKWQHGQATAFVLTGGVPLISPIIITVSTNSRPLFSRIMLDVDPALSPKELILYYRRNRRKTLTARHRNLSEKHMQLALFDSRRPKAETWVIKMDEWNKIHQTEWRYKKVSNFAHDCKQARRRLLRS